jgi:hypothetical protein
MESKIEETLRDPDMVVESRDDPEVKLYYRFYHRLGIGDKYMSVVVKTGTFDSFVITAYFTDKIKKGRVRWQR